MPMPAAIIADAQLRNAAACGCTICSTLAADTCVFFTASAAAAAIAAGLGVAFLLSQVRAVFFDPRSLTEMTGLPLLGTVSLNLDEAGVAKRKA